MDLEKIRIEVEDLQKKCWNSVIKQYFNKLSSSQVSTKSHDEDFQTIADLESEKFLTCELQALIPNSLVLGEEAQAAGQVGFDIFTSAQKDQYVWVIDPIDGTYNFVKGHDDFAVMVALVQNNETVGGWIYRPRTDDLISSVKGGALYHNGQLSGLSPHNDGDLSKISGYTPLIYSDRAGLKQHFVKQAQQLKHVTGLRCSGAHYLNIAKGQAEFYLVHHSKPWDHLAGSFLIKQGGGVSTQWDSTEYKPSDYKTMLLTANSQATYDALYNSFIKPIKP